MLLCTGLAAAFTITAALFVEYGFQHDGGALPLLRVVLFAENAFWAVSPLVGMTALLLFPGGRLSRAGHWALRAYAAVSVVVVVTQAIPAWYVATLPHLRFDAAGQVVGQHREASSGSSPPGCRFWRSSPSGCLGSSAW